MARGFVLPGVSYAYRRPKLFTKSGPSALEGESRRADTGARASLRLDAGSCRHAERAPTHEPRRHVDQRSACVSSGAKIVLELAGMGPHFRFCWIDIALPIDADIDTVASSAMASMHRESALGVG